MLNVWNVTARTSPGAATKVHLHARLLA
jgi:hypothetical protein